MTKLLPYICLIFLSVSIFVVFIEAQDPSVPCPPNQVWRSCGTACPPKCNAKPSLYCTRQCVIGCQCKWGYLLTSQGDCVAPEDCPDPNLDLY